MKKIATLTLILFLSHFVNGQPEIFIQNPILASYSAYCNNSMTFSCSGGPTNGYYHWAFSSFSSNNTEDKIYYESGDSSGFFKIVSGAFFQDSILKYPGNVNNGSVFTTDNIITVFNVPIGGFYIMCDVYNVGSYYWSPEFSDTSCVKLSGDSISNDTFNTYCNNNPVTIKNIYDTTFHLRYETNKGVIDTVTIPFDSSFEIDNLPVGINDIEYDLKNTNYRDTIKFYIDTCLIPNKDSLSFSNYKAGVCGGDSIVRFNFSYSSDTLSNTYFLNYSHFTWVIYDSSRIIGSDSTYKVKEPYDTLFTIIKNALPTNQQ